MNQSLFIAAAMMLTASAVSAESGQLLAKYDPAVAMHATVAAAVSHSDDEGPEGVEHVYETRWMQLFGDAIVDNNGLAHRVRFADDGRVYFYDFFAAGYDRWIEGVIDEKGVITIPTHQTVAEVELIPGYSVDMTIELSRFNISESSMSSDIDMDADSFTLLLTDDGCIVSPDLDKDWTERCYPVAYARNKVYALCGSINMEPCKLTVVTPPVTGVAADYSYSYSQQNIFLKADLVKTVTDGDDIYVQGLCPSLPDIWLKGTFDRAQSKVAFKSGQYMGFGQYHHTFAAVHANPNASSDNPAEPNWLIDDELVLDVEPDGMTINFNASNVFGVTISGDVAYALRANRLKPYTGAVTRPAKPVITTNGNELLWLEADFLPFVQPNADVEGNYLDTDNLYWRMYYDDMLFTFTPSEYMNLAESTTIMPYCFDDRWDFIVYTDVMEQCVAIYGSGYKNIGVESVYVDGDGKEYVSERAYFGEAPTSAVDVVGIDQPVIGSVYYDLSGRRADNAGSGMYIRVDTHADGTTSSHKVRVR